MRIIVVLTIALALGACGDLESEPSDAQQQQLERSFYGTGHPGQTMPPTDTSVPNREPVPGEVVPER
jgi:hypothetical protein